MGSTAPQPSADAAAEPGGTRQRLIRAAQQTVRQAGLGNASARAIASRAGASQGLIFYHFGTVSELLEAASNDAVDRSVRSYRDDLGRADPLGDLLVVGDALRRRERDNGNVTFMAQVMAGAQHDLVLARAVRHAMSAWIRELRPVLDRVLRHGGLAEVIDIDGLAPLIATGFIGLELYQAVDPTGATAAVAALESLAALVTTLDGLGPTARRAVRAAARRRN